MLQHPRFLQLLNLGRSEGQRILNAMAHYLCKTNFCITTIGYKLTLSFVLGNQCEYAFSLIKLSGLVSSFRHSGPSRFNSSSPTKCRHESLVQLSVSWYLHLFDDFIQTEQRIPYSNTMFCIQGKLCRMSWKMLSSNFRTY
jgi:hypothetical protein